MKRWGWRILRGTSLLLCVATIIFWVRSYWRLDLVTWADSDVRCTMAISSGHVTMDLNKVVSPGVGLGQGAGFSVSSHQPLGLRLTKATTSTIYFEFLGTGISAGTLSIMGFGSTSMIVTRTFHEILLPFWLIVLMMLMPPCVWLWLRRRARRIVLTGDVPCPRCGYDLRATPDRCPECGEEPKGSRAGSVSVSHGK